MATPFAESGAVDNDAGRRLAAHLLEHGSNGLVIAGSVDGHLYAIDGASGSERWRFKTGGAVDGPAAYAAGKAGRSADGLSCSFSAAKNASPAARCAAIRRQCGGKFYANYCGDKMLSAM